jgi:hypothetical protein
MIYPGKGSFTTFVTLLEINTHAWANCFTERSDKMDFFSEIIEKHEGEKPGESIHAVCGIELLRDEKGAYGVMAGDHRIIYRFDRFEADRASRHTTLYKSLPVKAMNLLRYEYTTEFMIVLEDFIITATREAGCDMAPLRGAVKSVLLDPARAHDDRLPLDSDILFKLRTASIERLNDGRETVYQSLDTDQRDLLDRLIAFPVQQRDSITRYAAISDFTRQTLTSCPWVAALLSREDNDTAHGIPGHQITRLLQGIMDGKSLKKLLRSILDLPPSIMKISPEAAGLLTGFELDSRFDIQEIIDILNGYPGDRVWDRVLCRIVKNHDRLFEDNISVQHIYWILRQLPQTGKGTVKEVFDRTRNMIDYLAATYDQFTRRFDPTLSILTILEESDSWHQTHERMVSQNLSREKFPQPWLDGFESEQGYRILPLDSLDELNRESVIMNNCADTYGRKVIRGKCYLYSLQKADGKRVATIELIRDSDSGEIEVDQVKGKSNSDAPPCTFDIIQQWLKTSAKTTQSNRE